MSSRRIVIPGHKTSKYFFSHPFNYLQPKTCEQPILEAQSGTVRIPAKLNAIPVGSRTAFRSEGEHPSERSDAGTTIVQKVFGFVKWERSKEAGSVIRSEAEEEGH